MCDFIQSVCSVWEICKHFALLWWFKLFCREFTHFWVENFQTLKYASVKKGINIRYAWAYLICLKPHSKTLWCETFVGCGFIMANANKYIYFKSALMECVWWSVISCKMYIETLSGALHWPGEYWENYLVSNDLFQ